jgi:hypothetical protein
MSNYPSGAAANGTAESDNRRHSPYRHEQPVTGGFHHASDGMSTVSITWMTPLDAWMS